MIGQTISHYRIVNRIGAGGMGEVYLAEDVRLGRKLAIKLLPEQFTQDADRVRRFELEARAASALNHPNIITIYEIGQHEHAHFIATEFIEGDTLRDKLKKGLKLSETLDIAVQTMSALQAAHQAGIIHRDIKPENIMLRPDGYVKLLDFGLAKLTQNEMETGDLEAATKSLFETQPGMVMGTIAYMSPEQARAQRLDGRTDIFSFGVVLYEMITSQRPFGGATVSDMIASLLTQEPTRLSQRLPGVPGELEQVVARMLAKDIEKRYAGAQEVLADLKRIKARVEVGDDDTTTRELGVPQPAAADSFETNVGAPVSFETTKGTAANLGVASAANAVQATNLLSAMQPARRRSRLLAAIGVLALLAISAAGYFVWQQRASKVDSIAVLPFRINDPQAEYLSDAITEQVIDALSQVPDLNVVARSSILKYKGKDTDPVELANQLDVRAALTGEVTRRGDEVIVNTELVSTANRRRLWGERYVRKLTELISLQDDITRGITQKLQLPVNNLPAADVAKAGTKDQEAYRLYLEGQYYFNQGTPEAKHKADELFEAAVARDSKFAAAAAGCAACHADGADQITPDKAMDKARKVAEYTLSLDPKSVDATLTLAKVKLRYDWDFKEAERLFKHALELNPKSAEAHQRYAEFLALMGKPKDALTEIWTARKLDPQSLAINTDIGTLSYYASDYEHAAEHFQKSLKLDEKFAAAHTGLGLVYEQKGQPQPLVNEWIQGRQLTSQPESYLDSLKQAFAQGGIQAFWQRELEHLQTETKGHYVAASAIAALHARLGETDQAFAALKQGLAEKDGGMVELKVAPVFASLRNDARFGEVLKRVGLAN
ncbi:MAG: protein kinase [Acidobacteria bacterium]|nr:protein kinase [Acidobacteriota bacterium]MBI3426012.1 protein kinase [Acidobacteriota bacterium]